MKIVRTNETPWADSVQKGNYSQQRKELGGQKLSCGLWKLAPGKKSFPFHAHKVTEEAMFVISGAASVRTPDGLQKLGPGDYVYFEPGGPAHQLLNDGGDPFIYVGISAAFGMDVVEYPDSGKISTAIQSAEGRTRWIFRTADQRDYFDGDEDAKGS